MSAWMGMEDVSRIYRSSQLLSRPLVINMTISPQDIRKNIKVARHQLNDEKSSKSYYTVIDELLRGPLPEEEKRDDRLFPEAVVLVNAAAETTTWSTFLSYD